MIDVIPTNFVGDSELLWRVNRELKVFQKLTNILNELQHAKN